MTRRRGEILSNVVTALVAICTVVATATIVRREFFQRFTPPRPNAPPERVANWASLSAAGHRIGPDNAPLTIVVFSDFECPACRLFATKSFIELEQKYPGKLSLVYRHWPLDMHRFAYPAARASECAAQQGRFRAFHDVVFANQKLLGLKTFAEMANESGVSDAKKFAACAGETTPVPAIEADIAEVVKLGGQGTPTVVIDGWLLKSGAAPAMIDSIVASLLSRKDDRGGG